MAQYRQKPVIVEAEQFDPWAAHRLGLPAGMDGIPSPGADNWAYEGCRYYLPVVDGRMEVKPGDWIIKGVNGERYLCKDRIFRDLYEIAYEFVETDE